MIKEIKKQNIETKENSFTANDFTNGFFSVKNIDFKNFNSFDICKSEFKKLGIFSSNFENIQIINSDFSKVSFYSKRHETSCKFKNVKILNSKFVDCNLFKSNFENVTFENCTLNNVCLNWSFLKNVVFKKVKFKNMKFSYLDFIGCQFIDCEFENCKYQINGKGVMKNIPENIKSQITPYEYKKNENSEEESGMIPQEFELNSEELPLLDRTPKKNDSSEEDFDNVFYDENQLNKEKIIQEGQVEDENEKLIQENKKEEPDLIERLDKEINDSLESEFNSLMDENVNLMFIVSNTKHNSQSEIEFNEKTKDQIRNLIINIFKNHNINDINNKIYLLKKSLEIGTKKILEISFSGTSFEFHSASEQNNQYLQM